MLLHINNIQEALENAETPFNNEDIERVMKAIRIHNFKSNLSTQIDELVSELQTEWNNDDYCSVYSFEETIDSRVGSLIPSRFIDVVELMSSDNELFHEFICEPIELEDLTDIGQINSYHLERFIRHKVKEKLSDILDN